jgi:hypothetical protein
MRSWEIEVIDFIFNFTLNKNKKIWVETGMK